ncbi:MAG: sulfite exporter TauE/SafE family protein [Steroidobacteraceae bacterium]
MNASVGVDMLAIIGALLIGLSLGLLGSGGSILTVPVLVFLVGEPEKLAIAESLGIVCVIAGVGALQHARQKHIDWRSVWLVGPSAMLGSYAGAWVSQWISGRVQLLMFAGVMLFAAYRMFINSRRDAGLQPSYCRPGCLLAVGAGLGILSGLVGVGGGFLVVPALVLLGGLAMPIAVGTSLMIITLSSLTGFAKQLHLLHSSGLTLHWPMLGLFAVVGVLGSLVSQPLGRNLPQARLQRAYSGMVVLMAALILWQTVTTAHQ